MSFCLSIKLVEFQLWVIEMIDVVATLAKYGYRPEDLAKNSTKKVIYKCSECEKSKEINYNSYQENKICGSCLQQKPSVVLE